MKSSYRAGLAALVTCCLALLSGGPGVAASVPAAAAASPSCEGSSPFTLEGEVSPTWEGACAAEPPEDPALQSSPCGCEPEFTIEKLQQIEGGESGFTTSPLTGAIGETVDYEIIVENTGLSPTTFAEFTDPHCEAATLAGGPGTSQLLPGESTTYSCSQVLSGDGAYTNEATVTGTSLTGVTATHTSNQVVVNVPSPPPPAAPQFTVEKLQQVAGTIGLFTTARLTAAAGQTLNYQIVVRNAGAAALTISEVSDEHCDPGTLTGGTGSAPLATGEATTFSCTRGLGSAGEYTNVATVTATNGAGQSLTVTSNQVEATVPVSHETPASVSTAQTKTPSPAKSVLASCEAERSRSVLHGASGPKRRTFSVSFPSPGIARIAFYLDGRKLKLLTQSHARHGSFTISINPRKLSHGTHKVAVKTRMTDRNCPTVAASSVFTDPKPKPPPPPG